jgi:hypothetical protein
VNWMWEPPSIYDYPLGAQRPRLTVPPNRVFSKGPESGHSINIEQMFSSGTISK